MPANLPPEARAKLAKYSEARTIEEKIRALEEFLSVAPKHKGAENLLLWARRRLAELREELELMRKKRRGSSGGPRLFFEKEGAGQIAVIGPPNTGKSLLVHQLTGARTRVADYPFSTQLPVPGMLPYKDIYFQLIDTPPLSRESQQMVTRIIGIVRNADAVIIVVSLDDDPVEQYVFVRDLLAEHGVLVEKPRGTVRIEKGGTGIQVVLNGRIVNGTINDIERMLASYRIYRARVVIEGEVSLDDVEMAIVRNTFYKPTIVVANKADLPGVAGKYRKLYNYLAERRDKSVWLIPVSARTGYNLDKIGELLFKRLDIVRVYTKQPNSEPSKTPLILRRGATVLDVAKKIHSDLVKYFLYAKIWGPSAKYPGERVGADHVVEDGDIVEIHSKR